MTIRPISPRLKRCLCVGMGLATITFPAASQPFVGTLLWGVLTANRVITLPDETGTVCTTGSICTGYADTSHATDHEYGGGDEITGAVNATSTGIDQDGDSTEEVAADGATVDIDPDDDGTTEVQFLDSTYVAKFGVVGGANQTLFQGNVAGRGVVIDHQAYNANKIYCQGTGCNLQFQGEVSSGGTSAAFGFADDDNTGIGNWWSANNELTLLDEGEIIATAYNGGSHQWTIYGGPGQVADLWRADLTGDGTMDMVLSAEGTWQSLGTGNARGSYAVDLQGFRGSATRVASGDYAAIPGGGNNTASGDYSFSMGSQCTSSGLQSVCLGGYQSVASGGPSWALGYKVNATGQYSSVFGLYSDATAYLSFASGGYAKADKYGQDARASGRFAADGDAQGSSLTSRISTTDGNATEMFLDGSAERMTIATDTAWTFTGTCVIRKTNGDNENGHYIVVGGIENSAGTTALTGATAFLLELEDDAAWDIDYTASDANDALQIECTAEANAYCVCKTKIVETTG